MMLRLALVWLICLSLTGTLTVNGQASSAMVTYRDGFRVALRNWTFRYWWAESSVRPPGFGVFPPHVKDSQDLHLERIERSIATAVVIPGSELQAITYIYSPGLRANEELVDEVVVRSAGHEYRFPIATFTPPDEYLSDRRFVYQKGLHLVGEVSQDAVRGRFDYDLGRLTGPKHELIEEIVFGEPDVVQRGRTGNLAVSRRSAQQDERPPTEILSHDVSSRNRRN